ncbi:toll/interleukin-1 receptor domain-containing protein, partial [Sandarakinorhabdus sp.]|uniref:toll/interleukin-1 receptor domain-containing protein n=1 Tax=Sandarakinorhabdus sp. TaxID=1916663 RepID=UPI00286E7A3C
MTLPATPIGPSGRPTTIFVSYSRDDRKRARPVIDALEKAGFSVWWDGLLQPGERFADSTSAALEGASTVVVLWSRISVTSHWVHDEATRGRDRKCLVPLSLDGSAPPLGFGQYQTIDISRARLSGNMAGDAIMAQVIAAVAALHDPAAIAAHAAHTAPDTTKSPAFISRRMALAGG